MQDDNVKVTCAGVDHPPIKMALAYRFDTANRSVVFSGGTRKTDTLIALVKAADVLVCEGQYLLELKDLPPGRPAANLQLRSTTAFKSAGAAALSAHPYRFHIRSRTSGQGQSRRFDDVRDVSASPSAAAEPVYHGEPAR
jgi:ribonuclease BN (tRNA processing enzyme)